VLDSQLRDGPLRGREAELAVIDRLVSALGAGDGGVLLLDGAAGIGKSRLAAEVLGRAQRSGLRILQVEAARGRFAPFPLLLDTALGLDSPVRSRPGTAFRSAAAADPLVIVIDDLHRADAETAMALRTLVAELRHVGVLWVLAARRAQAEPAVDDLLTHFEAEGAEVLRLGPLSPAAGVTVVADFVGAEVRGTLLEMVGGGSATAHPYWLTELLRGLREEGRLQVAHGHATVVGSEPPRRVVRAVTERLQALSPRTRQVVRMAAILPPSFTAAQLAGMVRTAPGDLTEPLDEAERADLLTVHGRGIRFRQGLVRKAMRETLASSLRRGLERESVDVLLRTGASPADVAPLLARTAEPGDLTASTTLRRAAEAIASADPGAAADLMICARDLLPAGDAVRGPLLVRILTYLHRAMRTDEARELADRAVADSAAGDAAAVLASLSTAIARPAAERAEANRTALTLRDIGPRARAEHRGWLAYNLMAGAGADEVEQTARAALAEAIESQDGAAIATARVILAAAYCGRGNGTAASIQLDLVPALRPGAHPPMRDLLAASLLHCLGRTAEGTALLSACLERARSDNDGPTLGLGIQLSAVVNVMTGRLEAARIQLESPGPLTVEDVPVTLATVLHMSTSTALAQHLGDAALGSSALATARRLRTSNNVLERRSAHRVLAAAAAARGDAAHAARLLADDPLMPSGLPLPVSVGTLTLAAWIAVALGDRSLGDRVAAAATSMAAGAEGAPAFAAGAAYLRAILGQEPDALLSAASLLIAADRPLLSALALEDAGKALLRRGRKADAAAHLSTALDRFAETGAVVDVTRVKRTLRSQGSPRRLVDDGSAGGWSTITESELRVVRLIAAGTTNRGAAQQLFISPHTVNAHVRSVFAKLGIRSRVQLANAFRDNGS